MDQCGNTIGCKSVKWQARIPQGADINNPAQCLMFELGPETPPTKCDSGEHDAAIMIEPPTVPAPKEELQLKCATDCPAADGKLHTTENGEVSVEMIIAI
jgi:hypothetical protein